MTNKPAQPDYDTPSVMDAVLREIKQQEITPRPRWQFVMRDYILWSFLAAATIVGAIVMAIVFTVVSDHPWELMRFMKKGKLQFAFTVLPYIWIVLYVVIIGIAWKIAQETKHGYKRMTYILATSLLLSIVLGMVLSVFAIGRTLLMTTQEYMPGANAVLTQDSWLHDPSEGRIAGRIIAIDDESNLWQVEDAQGQVWSVAVDDDAHISSVGMKDNAFRQRAPRTMREVSVIKTESGLLVSEIETYVCPVPEEDKKFSMIIPEVGHWVFCVGDLEQEEGLFSKIAISTTDNDTQHFTASAVQVRSLPAQHQLKKNIRQELLDQNKSKKESIKRQRYYNVENQSALQPVK